MPSNSGITISVTTSAGGERITGLKALFPVAGRVHDVFIGEYPCQVPAQQGSSSTIGCGVSRESRLERFRRASGLRAPCVDATTCAPTVSWAVYTDRAGPRLSIGECYLYIGVPHAKWLTSRRGFFLVRHGGVVRQRSGAAAPFQKEVRPGSDGRVFAGPQAESVAAAFEYVERRRGFCLAEPRWNMSRNYP